MAAISARSPRDGTETAEMSSPMADGASNNSHTSASRAGGLISRSASASSAPSPLSLADALSRAGGDYAAALDEVLAERNKLALDSAKLNSENVRIWNLMGRIRKENEAMKAKVLELERGSSNGSASRASPLAPAAVIAPASPMATRRRLPGNLESEQAGGLLNSPKTIRTTTYADSPEIRSNTIASHTTSFEPGQTPTQQFQNGGGSTDTRNAAPILQTTGLALSRELQSGLSPTFDPSAARSPTSPTQQSSIIQQRAAAQAQSLARGLHRHNEDSLGSGESGDFEAVDHSSVSGTDDGSVGEQGFPERSSTEPTAYSPGLGQSSNRSTRAVPDQLVAHNFQQADSPSQGPPSPSLSLSQASASAASSIPDRRSLPPRSMTDDRTLASSRSVRAKDSNRRLTLAPRLDASLLRVVVLKIVATNYKQLERGKDAISFFITVDILQPPSSWTNAPVGEETPPSFWTLEKNYSDILGLDARLRQKYGKKTAQRLAPLPDKGLFKDHAPAKVDQRKALLEIYLQSLLVLELPDKNDICTFLCTDVVPDFVKNTLLTHKDGFLTKKGQNLGRWVTRFYVLRQSTLKYYETRGGAQIGSINIKDAQIGRQQKTSSPNETDENSYRHAFLILEKRPGNNSEPPHIARHVLCAESDEERDEWVDVLVRAIAEMEGGGTNGADASKSKSPSQQSFAAASSQGSSGSVREPLSPRDRLEGSTGANTAASSSGDSVSHGPSRKSDREAQPLSPPSSANTDLPRSSTSRREPVDQPNGAYGAALSGLGQHGLTVNPSMPSSASGRTLNEPRSPIGRPGLGRESQDTLGSPGPKHEGLPRGKPAISGPMNGAPIPTGYKFGAKDESVVAPHDGKKDDKKRFWQGFRGFGHHDKGSPREPRPVFGVPLAESIAVSSIHEGLELPSVVYRCIEYLEKTNAAMEEGIYRLSGSSAVIKTLKDRFNTEGDVDLLASDQYYDPHAIAGLLKTFLRELPTSVLTRELHLEFMRLNDIEDRTQKVNELGHLVSMLPLANYSLLRTLCSHLIKIIEHADVNKMTMRNVGIVFSPTLAIGAGIFALFLTEFDNVFFTDAKGDSTTRLVDDENSTLEATDAGYVEDGASAAALEKRASSGTTVASRSSQQVPLNKARSKRNSLQYRDSQAERMLGLEGRRLSFREREEDWAGIGAGGGGELQMHLGDPRGAVAAEDGEVPVRR
ncbi:Rho GTPase activating protein [Thecaphora frezii]